MRGSFVILVLAAACGGSAGKPDAFVQPLDAPVLASIAISGPTTISAKLPPVQFTATATYGDNSTKVVTLSAMWMSSNAAVASVAAGVVTPITTGTTTIEASLDGKTNMLNLTVTPPTLVVSNFGNSELVFLDPAADGAATALRMIAGTVNTNLTNPRGITVVNGEVYVANQGGDAITVYSVNDTGDVPPTRTITGPSTTLASPSDVEIFNNDLYVGLLSGTVLVFPADANGNVTPTRTISMGASRATGIKVFNNELYVSDVVGSTMGQGRVLVVPVNSSGTVTPTRTITSAAFDGPQDLEISDNEIYTANEYSSSITVFPVTANGTSTPTRTITGLHTPAALLVLAGELYTTNESPPAIQVYPASVNGAQAPTRTITNSDFSGTIGIAAY